MTAIGNLARQPRPPPPTAFNPASHKPPIHFLHPGYKEGEDILVRLPRVDCTDAGEWGVHRLTALTACQILAGNAFNGYLSTTKDGQAPSASDNHSNHSNDVLTEARYWFLVPDKPRYAIVPNFQEWRFPASLPASWRDATMSTSHVPIFNGHGATRCVVDNTLSTTSAHLIPRAHGRWYNKNTMSRFASNHFADVNHLLNLIPLGSSLHNRLDRGVFAFVPKGSRSSPAKFVVHTLQDLADETPNALPEFVSAYQNLPAQLDNATPREYIFARFAANVLLFSKDFLMLSFVPRSVLRYCVDDNGIVEHDGPVEMGPQALQEAFGAGGSRSASPKKRNRSAHSQRDESEAEGLEHECGYLVEDYQESSESEEEGRGRSRFR